MAIAVQNTIHLITRGIPREAARLLGREVANYDISLDVVASTYQTAHKEGVSQIAAATMVNVIGYLELDKTALETGVRCYLLRQSLPYVERSFAQPVSEVMFKRFRRGVDAEEEQEIFWGMKAMEEVL